MLSHTRTGTNWVRNLPKYMSCVNNEKREALGWQSPFEIYFGRKNNNLVNCGLPIDTASPEVGLSRPPSKDDRSKFDIARFTAREKARKCNDRVDKRTVEYYRKRSKCSTYGVKEKVFVRIGDKKRAPKKRHVLTGTITKLGKNGNSYKVEYKNPKSGQLQNDWFSVENIADFGGHKNRPKKKKNQYQEQLRSMLSDPIESFDNQGFAVSYNPPGDGNCQFSAICKVLRQFGFERSPASLRAEIVSYLVANPVVDNGYPIEEYLEEPFSVYINRMARNGAYVDEKTL